MKATDFLSEWKTPKEIENWDNLTDTVQNFIHSTFALEDVKKVEIGPGLNLVSIETASMTNKQIEKLSEVPSFHKIYFQDGNLIILEFGV